MTGKEFLALSVTDFAAATADKTPTPGGGSVAGVVGVLAVALGEMSLNFTRGKKKFAQHEEYYARLGKRLTNARKMYESLVADDVAAYGYYVEVTKQPDGPAKDEAMQVATAAAIAVPREATKLGLALLADLRELADKCNPWLISDLTASATLAFATIKLSNYNVRINAPNLSDKAQAREVVDAANADVKRAWDLLNDIENVAAKDLDKLTDK